jgi:multiple sugar transport system substrate-binding protein
MDAMKEGRMRKGIMLALIMALLALGAFGAFAGGTKEAGATDAKVTVTFACRTEQGSVLDARKKALAEFAAKFPNVTVVVEELPHSEFWVKIPAEIAAKTGPDVISLPFLEQAVTFAAKGMLTPLDAFADGKRGIDRKDWYETILNYGVYGGKLLVLPQVMMTTGLAYNKDMFDAAGVSYPTEEWTWEDMLSAALKLTLDGNGNNAESKTFNPDKTVQWGIYTWWWNSDFALYLFNFGGDWLDAKGTKSLLNSPQAIDAIRFYGDLTQKYHVAPYLRELAPAHGHPALMAKKVAMAFVDIGNISLVDGAGINWGMQVIPQKKGVGKRSAFFYGEGLGISKDAKSKDASWELTKFLATAWDPNLAKQGYGFPPTRSAMKEMKALQLSPKVLPLLKMYESGWPKAIRATDYAGMVIDPCNMIMEAVLSKGASPDYASIMQKAAALCDKAILEAPPLQ